ncbi:hypothetical protein CHS0354_038172 [Potamilus streckersoni]|uniref:Uncharacterized protein n=1 Tax=Potamilus streckersoni TaxID=2493646 RepID=A0AAE0T0N0_9BIVA|nr:hypothetical protein CHS0354_038172 [Potamilus streckersoni]
MKGFQAIGICPLDTSVISDSAYQPSTVYERKNTQNLPSCTAFSSAFDQFFLSLSLSLTYNLKKRANQSLSAHRPEGEESYPPCRINSLAISAAEELPFAWDIKTKLVSKNSTAEELPFARDTRREVSSKSSTVEEFTFASDIRTDVASKSFATILGPLWLYFSLRGTMSGDVERR